MAPRDPVTNLLTRAKQRHANAEREVAGIQPAIARELVAPSRDPKRDHLRDVLDLRVAERNKTPRALQNLQRKPRLVLEKEVADTNSKEGT